MGRRVRLLRAVAGADLTLSELARAGAVPEPGLVYKALAYINNATVTLKRTVDVMYKLANIARDNALMKMAVSTWGLVDATMGKRAVVTL